MADIYLAYRVQATGDEQKDVVDAQKGLAELTSDVLSLIESVDFVSERGDVIDVSTYVCEWDEDGGIVTASDSILVSGGLDALDLWSLTKASDLTDGDCLGCYTEELHDCDWMPFRDLVLAMDKDLGGGVSISFDCCDVKRDWHGNGYRFFHYSTSVDVRTTEEVERDRIASQKRLEAQRLDALKSAAEKEERRKKREPLLRTYDILAKRFGYAFRFVNADHAISQGIRISPTTAEAAQFLETLNCKKSGGSFKYRFASVDSLEQALNKFAALQNTLA